jgi:hypothetical protein
MQADCCGTTGRCCWSPPAGKVTATDLVTRNLGESGTGGTVPDDDRGERSVRPRETPAAMKPKTRYNIRLPSRGVRESGRATIKMSPRPRLLTMPRRGLAVPSRSTPR